MPDTLVTSPPINYTQIRIISRWQTLDLGSRLAISNNDSGEPDLLFRCGHAPRIGVGDVKPTIWCHRCISWVKARGGGERVINLT
jgi:hypothetical protein